VGLDPHVSPLQQQKKKRVVSIVQLLLTRAADDAEKGRQQQQRGDAALPRLHGFKLDLTNFVTCQKGNCGKGRAAAPHRAGVWCELSQ
jgi:hypothetical protein